ncbi:MAG TPA: S8 family peptidase [Polyangiaceae bacterium]|nr:S8 family peptidase [Polyangiaceae bacterium]
MRPRILAPLGAGLLAALALLTPRPAPAQTVAATPTVDPTVLDAPTFGDETAGADQIPGEIAVDLRDDASDSDVTDLDTKVGIVMHPNSGWSTTHDRLEVADVDVAREPGILDVLSHDPRVEHAEPMALYRATFVPDDPLYESKQWHLKRVGAESAWGYSCGQGVTVAVIDTGVACFDKGPFSRGTDLAGTRCEGGWNFVADDGEAADDHGHGTHVAGTIAQTTNNGVGTAGLAYCATLMPVKVLSKQGFGTVANVAEGIRFAADNGAQVINMSLGGPIKSKIIEDAVNHALSKGVIIVAAAGNSGKSVGWPAAYPGVVAVSATDDKDKIAWFSSRGPEVAIAAPGVAVTQQTVCNGGQNKCEIFGTFNGTSMASPHVAGVAAMVESLGVTDPAAVREALTSSARPNGEPKLYGAGILDAAAAASHVFWRHVVFRGLALLALGLLVGRRIRKRGGKVTRTAGAVVGALVASVGLLPVAPLLGLAAHAGKLRTSLELAMRPLGDWDLVLLGAGTHRWLLVASALPAIVLTMLGFASKRARPFIGGIALGTAALLAQLAWSGEAAFVGGPFLARLWTVANALVCLWLARMALDAKRA